jgi:hypothetical protein
LSTATRQRRCRNASPKAGFASMPSALSLMLAQPTLMSLAQYGTTFRLGAKFGAGRPGKIAKRISIPLTSEDRRARPQIGQY